VPYLGAGIALYDILADINYHATGSGTALALTKDKQVPTIVTKYTVGGCPGAPAANTPLLALQQSPCASNAISVACPATIGVASAGNAFCTYTYLSNGSPSSSSGTIYWSQQPGFILTTEPRTLDQLADDIALTSGWPATSSLAKATTDALVLAPSTLATQSMAVSGPATSTGTTSSTTNADGTKTTVTQTFNHTYAGDTINTVTNTTTNNYNTSNQVTTTTSTTATPATAPNDTKTDCDKYPDSIGCSKYGDMPSGTPLPKTSHGLSLVAQAFAGSTACPSPITFTALGRSYSLSYEGLCRALAQIKPLIMALAGFAAAYILADSFKV